MAFLFSFSSFFVLPFWFLMVVLPYWRWTRRIMQSPLIVVPVAFIYFILVLPQVGTIFSTVVSPNLNGISHLLSSPTGATIAWVHFLAFDLFVGRWIYQKSRAMDISAWIMAPVLFLTLMLGPIGLLLFLLVRSIVMLSGKKEKEDASHSIKNSFYAKQ